MTVQSSWVADTNLAETNVTIPSGTRDTSRGTSETVTTNLCAGAACVTEWVQFSAPNYDLIEGTDTDSNSQNVCVQLVNDTPLIAHLVVPIDLAIDDSTAVRAAYTVTNGAATNPTTHIDSTTADTDLSFDVTFPLGALGTVSAQAQQCFSIVAVPNAVDPAGTGPDEDTTVAFAFGDSFATPSGTNIVTSQIESTTVTIKDDDGPNFTVTLSQSSDSLSAAAAEGASVTNEFLVNVAVDVELEESVTIALTPTLNGGATATDFDVPATQVADDNTNELINVTAFDSITNTITITLDGSVGPTTAGLNFRVVALDDTDQDVGESITLGLSVSQSTTRTIMLNPSGGLEVKLLDNDSNTIRLSLSTDTTTEDGMAPNPLTITATVKLFDTSGTLGNTNALMLSVGVDPSSTASMGSGATDDYDISDTLPLTFTIPADAAHDATVDAEIVGLSITNDTTVEPAETIVFSMSSFVDSAAIPAPVTDIQVESATFTITDDATDTATLTLTGPADPVTEGSDAVFTLAVDQRIESDFVVEWSFDLVNSEADNLEDLGLQSLGGEVQFTGPVDPSDNGTITIPTIDDDISEGTESIALTLSIRDSDVTDSVQSHITIATPSGSEDTATIAASDDLTISLNAPETANEGDIVTFSAELAGGVATTNIRVALGLSSTPPDGGGVAATAEDLGDGTETTFPETFIIIDAGSDTGSTNVTIFKDTVADPETLVMELSNPQALGDHDDDDQTADDWGAISAPVHPGTIALSTTPTDIRKETTITEIGTVEVSLDATSKAEDAATDADRTFTATVSFGGDIIAGSGNVDITWTVNIDDENNTDENITADADDFTSPLTGTLQFTRGATAPADQTFDIVVADDTLSEQAEGFMVTLAIVGTEADVVVRSNEVRGSIDASDPIILVLSGPVDADNDPITRFAEDTSATFTVTGTGGTTAGTFDVILVIGNASTADDTDVSIGPRHPVTIEQITDAATGNTGTVEIRFEREAFQQNPEGDETIEWELAFTGAENVVLPTTALTITIVDNIVEVASVGVGNEGEAVTLTFSVNSGTSGTGVLQFAIAEFAQGYVPEVGEDPAETADLTLPSPLEVQFDGSETSLTVDITIVNDELAEEAETFTVVLLGWKEESGAPPSIAANAFVGAGTEKLVTINPSDALTVNLSALDGPGGQPITEIEEGGSFVLLATITGGTSSEDVDIAVGFDPTSVADVADVTNLTATSPAIAFTIPAGAASGESPAIAIEINEDGDPEPDMESLLFTFTSLTGGGHPEDPAAGTIATITINNVSTSFDLNGDGRVDVVDALVAYYVLDFPTIFGRPSDHYPVHAPRALRLLEAYIPRRGTGTNFVKLMGIIEKVFAIQGESTLDINGDQRFDTSDALAAYFVLSQPSIFGSVPGTTPVYPIPSTVATAGHAIALMTQHYPFGGGPVDDLVWLREVVNRVFTLVESASGDNGTTTVTITSVGTDIAEGGSATFMATFDGPIDRPILISWRSSSQPRPNDIAATALNSDGNPYMAIPAGTITATALSHTFGLSVEDDDRAEGAEMVRVTFAANVESVIAADQDLNVVASDPITVTVTGPTIQSEGESADYTVTLGGGTRTEIVTLTIAVGSGGTGQATDVSLPTPATVTVAPDTDTAVFPVTMTDDGYDVAEDGETIVLTVTGTHAGGAIVTSGDSPPVTISQLPSVSVIADVPNVDEDAGPVTFTVSLSHVVDESVTIDWAITHRSTRGAGAADFVGPTSGTVTFVANDRSDQTIEVTINDDNFAEVNETFAIYISFGRESIGLAGSKVIMGPAIAMVTINANDNPTRPGIPEGLSAIALHNRVTLTWLPPSNVSPRELEITGYRLQVLSTGGGGSWEDIMQPEAGLRTTFNHRSLPFNQEMRYRIAAHNALGDGLFSSTVAATTFDYALDADGYEQVTSVDALGLVYSLHVLSPTRGKLLTNEAAAVRRTFLGSLNKTDGDDDQHFLEQLELGREMEQYGAGSRLNVNDDEALNAADALAIYYSITYPELVGDGTTTGGFESFRQVLLRSLHTAASPTDGQLLELVRKVRQLLRD